MIWGAILVSITPNYFLTLTPRSYQDLLFIIYLHRSSIELLDLRRAKWLWSGFGYQVHSTPIQSKKITGSRILKISPSITVTSADDPQTRRLVYTITFLTYAKRTSRSTKHLEPVSTSYNYQPNRKLIPKKQG